VDDSDIDQTYRQPGEEEDTSDKEVKQAKEQVWGRSHELYFVSKDIQAAFKKVGLVAASPPGHQGDFTKNFNNIFVFLIFIMFL